MTARKIATCDCETDPFLHGRIPKPFIWGYYDGDEMLYFDSTKEFVEFLKPRKRIVYAHNGGKFDFMLLLSYAGPTRAQIINGRIVSMMLGQTELRDSFAAVPQGLGSIKKDEIEYWKMEAHCRADHMPEIKSYLRGDCVYLYELMDAYRQAAGTKKTIASNALAHANKLGIDPGKTNHRFDANYRPYYFGGRTECFKPGEFENISVFDIRSSYPRAMMDFHPTGNEFKRRDNLNGFTREEIQRGFVRLRCYSAGAFPLRTQKTEGLRFPHETNEYHVTGWEYIAAKELGLIDNEQIIEFRYTHDMITFRDYVQHWFEYKQAHNKKTQPIEYTIGKIMMNSRTPPAIGRGRDGRWKSLYGKLAQNPEKYHDYKIVEDGARLPCNEPHLDKENICRICGFKDTDHGWTFYTKFEGKTFHRRESLWKHRYRYGGEWESKPLYKNVATGASITGFARASLLRAIHTVGREHVIYCDTDSLVVTQFARTEALPQSEKLGDWEKEIYNAPFGFFAGKKLYAIDFGGKEKCTCEARKGTCKRHKVVTKGARLTFSELKRVVQGENIEYEPVAPSFSLANGIDFIDRNIRRTMQ